MAELREVTIELPSLPLLSLNDRAHWTIRNGRAQVLKKAAWLMALKAKAPHLQRAEITVEYQPPDKRRRDPDNLAPTGKAALDGLVLAGVLPDDDARHVTVVRYTIGQPYRDLHKRGRIILHVREIGEQP
jgi:crossover junction endodeoxyribonuclease RusA